ncbi:MAG: hypothetical protein HUN04_18865 [Desulfobacter sp.]|nr:MAG: hypothetical protein HUN04_18865 [Desulfobacter sp.]
MIEKFLSDRGGRRRISDRRFRVGAKHDPERRTGWKRRSGWDRRYKQDPVARETDQREESSGTAE